MKSVGLAQMRLFAGAMILGPMLLLGSSVAFAAGGGLNEDELGVRCSSTRSLL